MKHYACLVPGCPWHTTDANDAEIIRRASAHLRDIHGETIVRPEMIARIKQRVTDAAPASASG